VRECKRLRLGIKSKTPPFAETAKDGPPGQIKRSSAPAAAFKASHLKRGGYSEALPRDKQSIPKNRTLGEPAIVRHPNASPHKSISGPRICEVYVGANRLDRWLIKRSENVPSGPRVPQVLKIWKTARMRMLASRTMPWGTVTSGGRRAKS
jgi:hypothetical protein